MSDNFNVKDNIVVLSYNIDGDHIKLPIHANFETLINRITGTDSDKIFMISIQEDQYPSVFTEFIQTFKNNKSFKITVKQNLSYGTISSHISRHISSSPITPQRSLTSIIIYKKSPQIIVDAGNIVRLNSTNSKSYILFKITIDNNKNIYFINAHLYHETSLYGLIERIKNLTTIFTSINLLQSQQSVELNLYILSGDLNFRSHQDDTPPPNNTIEELNSLIKIIEEKKLKLNLYKDTNKLDSYIELNKVFEKPIKTSVFKKLIYTSVFNKKLKPSEDKKLKPSEDKKLKPSENPNLKNNIDTLYEEIQKHKYIIKDYIYKDKDKDNESIVPSCKVIKQSTLHDTKFKNINYDKKRNPSYCDRILFIIPDHLSSNFFITDGSNFKTILNVINTSDHLGVQSSKKYLKYKKKYLELKNYINTHN
jgi:hypothetical protein